MIFSSMHSFSLSMRSLPVIFSLYLMHDRVASHNRGALITRQIFFRSYATLEKSRGFFKKKAYLSLKLNNESK